jgi:hypothetical protein
MVVESFCSSVEVDVEFARRVGCDVQCQRRNIAIEKATEEVADAIIVECRQSTGGQSSARKTRGPPKRIRPGIWSAGPSRAP